jgi:hypothetical protein
MLNKVTLFRDKLNEEVLFHVYQGDTLVPVPRSPRAWNTIARYGTPIPDKRPTKAAGKERIQDFRDRRDSIVETWKLIPDEIIDKPTLEQNIPWWVVAPFYVAPYVAEALIEIDPLDLYQE